ncbi:MAG TPA: hypothetical protein VNH83_26655, partial [Bryobacteraceae bacterium]|nr:hypothetical protein [Bryobacteraceae bacterium]
YERALEYNVKDDALGNDGSSWCLETTRGFTYSKACFWSPEYNTEERHLTGMLALGRALWHLAAIDDKLYRSVAPASGRLATDEIVRAEFTLV